MTCCLRVGSHGPGDSGKSLRKTDVSHSSSRSRKLHARQTGTPGGHLIQTRRLRS
jgi:hypothetical protein